jgi:hypothetical protein
MTVLVNLAAIPITRTQAAGHATKEIPIAKAKNPINTDIDNMMMASEV